MRQIMQHFALILVTIFSLTACDDNKISKNDALKNIPKDVSMVTAIDLPALMEKADFDHVKTMEFYEEIIKEARKSSPILGEVVADPAKSGIDLAKSFYMVHEINPNNPEENFIGAVFSMKDVGAFEKLVNDQGAKNITKMDNFDLTVHRNQSVAWNEELVVFGTISSYNDITPYMEKYFKTEAETSIAGDKDLQKLLAEKHDISSWFSSNSLANSDQVKMILPMANISPDALKDNFFHSQVDFNKGEIVGKTATFLNEGLRKDLKLFFKDEVKTDFSKYVPDDRLNTLVTAAIDVKGIRQVIAERPQSMSFINFALKQYGVTLDDIANTFGGDLLIASNNESNKAVGLFAIDIKDEAGLKKFLDLGIEYELIEKVGENHFRLKQAQYMGYSNTVSENTAPEFIIKDKLILASTNAELINDLKNNNVKSSDNAKIVNKVSKNVFGLFMDYEALAEMMESGDVDIQASTLEISAKRKNSDFKLEFKDQNTNSLKQLFEMINDRYLKEKTDRPEFPQEEM